MDVEVLRRLCKAEGELPWTLSAAHVFPEIRPRFTVQILHGFSDHKERYFPLMRFFAACGGIALIHDLRGHGNSLPAETPDSPEDGVGSLGYGYETLFDDVDEVYAAFGNPSGRRLPDPAERRPVPRFLLGEDMGALMAALYASRRSSSIDGVILAGLPKRDVFSSPKLFALGCLSLFTGDAASLKGLDRRAFSRYDRDFTAEEDGAFLWLANDPAVRDAFAGDPLCNRPHPLGDYRNLLRMTRDVWRPSSWDKPSDIPVLLMAGQCDPVAGGDDAMIYAGKFFKDMGFSRVEQKMYWQMRHEIFFDKGREGVFMDAARFMLSCLPKPENRSGASRDEGEA